MSNSPKETGNKVINELDAKQIGDVIDALRTNAETGPSPISAKTVWKGGFVVETDVKGFKVLSDEPCALGGTDKAPAPMALLLGAYGACFGISYILIATTKGVEIEKLEIELEGDVDLPLFLALDSQPDSGSKPGFSEIRTKVFVSSSAPKDKLKEIHEMAATLSPVGQTFVRPINVKNEFSVRRLS